MLIDDQLPEFDATRIEHAVVDASPARTWQALTEADFMQAHRGSPAIRVLFGVRGATSALVRRLTGAPDPPEPEAMRPAGLSSRGEWVKLGEVPGEELLIGAIGRFWGRDIDWLEIDAADFSVFAEPGYGKVAAGFSLRPYGERRTLLTYETRTHATDEAARRGFVRYWRIVSPGVGIVLRSTLRYIAGLAESASPPPGAGDRGADGSTASRSPRNVSP